MTNKPPDRKLVIAGFLALILAISPVWAINTSEEPPNPSGDEFYLVQENSLKAQVIPVWFKPPVYGSLIECLSFYESTHNPEAVGDNGKAYGILQFHLPTFDFFCEKYELVLDYTNPEDQKILAEYMLQDNINNVVHWSVYRNCI